jgi:hypothetical protein
MGTMVLSVLLASACASIAGITDIKGIDGGDQGGDSAVGSGSGAPGSSSGTGPTDDGSSGAPGSSSGPTDGSSGARESSASPNDSSAGSASGAGSSSGDSSGGSEASSSDSPNDSSSSGGSSGPLPDSGAADADSGSSSGSCTKGQVGSNEVVMIGDSYMDVGNVGPTIMKDANNATYRHYYLAGSALNYGSGSLNIPYQFDTQALMDTAVANPTDIKVVIMDGGINDVLIDNSQCLTTPIGSDTNNTCHTAVDSMVARGGMLERDMANKGVQAIVYYFVPDLDSTVSGHQNLDDWIDYAYPNAAAACCGAANVPASGDTSCHGNGPSASTECIWIDTRPAFVEHTDHTNTATYWFQSDNVHPTQAGADAIAAKVWAAMQTFCIAQ